LKTKLFIDPMHINQRLTREFFARDVLIVAPLLIGKKLVLGKEKDIFTCAVITDVEAYRGVEDKACHASRGRTPRTEVMFQTGGKIYVYFVYGMYWMLNIVTGEEDNPQAVLIRGVEGITGPGRITKKLGIDGSFYGEDLTESHRIWIEDSRGSFKYTTGPRIGIDYSGEPWKNKPWRFILEP
jgi:DNA-3-methyladenine glycosylase